MGKKTKLGKTRRDKFYQLAKDQGYRSRAAFKLIQLNKKYNFLGSAKACIDLCAAPGGWLQVASKYMPVSSVIVGVDLVPIRPIRNVVTYASDITTDACRTSIKNTLKTLKADVVLHDGAPNMGRAWEQDAYMQVDLTLKALKLAVEFLNKGGYFVTKVFRSHDYNSLLWVFHQLFKRVEATKPAASRNTSAEIFVVCQGFLAPQKLDPKLLDPKYVFKQLDPAKKEPQIPTANTDRKRKKSEGYEDGTTILFKKCTVSDFINAQNPVAVLAEVNQIYFDENDKEYLSHPRTTKEIIACLDDLKVLGKGDFMKILRWRTALKDAFQPQKEEEEEEPQPEEQDDLETYEALLSSQRKKEKKKALERKRKIMERIQLGIAVQGDNILEGTTSDSTNLFQLGAVEDKEDLDAVLDADEIIDSDSDDSDGYAEEEEEDRSEDYQATLDEDLEASYARYKAKKAKREKEKISFVQKSLLDVGEADEGEDVAPTKGRQNPLIKRALLSKDEKVDRWFGGGIFEGMDMNTDNTDDNEFVQENSKKRKHEAIKATGAVAGSKAHSSGFEVVPKGPEITGDISSDDEEDDKGNDSDTEDEYDVNKKMEILALGTAMLRKKTRLAMEDDSWNRYTDNGGEFAPDWYAAEVEQYFKPQIPITKEAAAAIKARQKELDARPIKKVAEAHARKRMRKAAKLAKTREKAQSIIKDPDMSVAQKISAAHKVMKQAGDKKKEKVYLVSKRASGVGATKPKYHGGSRVKVVDPRMKKDLRAAKQREKTVGRSKRAKAKGKKK